VISALAAGGVFLWTQDTRRGAQTPAYSVQRADDRGAALVYRLYGSAGLRPQVWDQELTHLKAPGLLILLDPARPRRIFRDVEIGTEGDFLPHEIKALDDWVKQGNVVVVMTREANDLYGALGLIVDEPRGISATPAEPAQPSRLAMGVNKLQTQTRFGFKFGRKTSKATGEEETAPETYPIPEIPAAAWVELFTKKDGQRSVPQVVSAARGKGLYVAVNDIWPAGNLGVTNADNARFMLNLAHLRPASGAVWFDEYHKRPVERGLVTYFRERNMLPTLVYLLLLAALLFWRTGTRFGPADPLVADRRRDSGEYVRAVASLYQNAGMTREAVATVYADFRKRLVGALRMDGLTDLEEVGRRYEMKTGRPAIEAREILIQAEAALARVKVTEAEAQQLCARLAQLDQALLGRGIDGGRRRKS
jgi:hypothetical protein